MNDMNLVYPVSRDFGEYAEKFWRRGIEIENLSLVFEKAPPFVKDGKDRYHKSSLSSVNKIFKNVREFESFLNYIIRTSLNEYERYFETYTELVKCLSKLQSIRLATKSRLVIGLGDESVYEASIRLHRNYGVPYIPGSALKGVAKHYVILSLTDQIAKKNTAEDFFKIAKKVQEALEVPAKNENDKRVVEKIVKEKLNVKMSGDIINEIKILRKIFGTQKRESSIIFFDAFPTPDQLKDKPILELDIMNPHYQPYYSANERELKTNAEKAPGDWHDPNPIFFLTVPKDVEFQFAIAPRDENGVKLLDKAKELLISALGDFGVGAKTALGYGRLEYVRR